jgi:hypothetical protein
MSHPMSGLPLARLRALAEAAHTLLVEAQAIYADEGQTPRWETAKNKYLNALYECHAACSPPVVLSLLSLLDALGAGERTPTGGTPT